MKKIPTLFQRDPADRAHVLPEVITGGCHCRRSEAIRDVLDLLDTGGTDAWKRDPE